jgi:cyclopropane-fatty-acyl-phospholipid synthase
VKLSAAATRCLSRRLHGGTLLVQEPDRRWLAGDGEPVISVSVADTRTFDALLRRSSVGLAESYAKGWWEADDLTGLVRVLLRSTEELRSRLDRAGRRASPAIGALARLAPPGRDDDRRNVQAHYDLPGELFAMMLDETMAYSCAIFDRPEMSLADAQRAKFDRLCEGLCLGPEDHLLEIGTGWGGLAVHAAARYGCRVTSTTISDAQREVAAKRVAEAGVADKVTILGVDYRDLEGVYDKLVSVEMIEAVDWRLHDGFFGACSRLLAPNGLMALQAITIDDRSFERAKHHDDFIRRMIFPGGCIISVEAIARSVSRVTDLTVIGLEDIGRHYPETLRRWRSALRANTPRLQEAGLDEQFRRLWDLYLCYCEAAFLERHISDVQVLLAKPLWDVRRA